ncbi:MAG: GerAB/ArcD/ProY family transporter [Bacteroidota bacterium]
MSKEKTVLSPWLFLPLLILPPLSYGLLNLPFYAAQSMGAKGYLGVPVAAIMSLPGLAAIFLLARLFPGQSIIQYGQTILGPIFGRIMGLLYLGFNLVLLAVFTRDQIDMAISYLLDRSPLSVVVLTLLLATAYLASRGLETIARLASFVMLPALALMAAILATGFQNISLTHVQPIAGGVFEYLQGGYSSFYIFYPAGLAAILTPFLKPLPTYPRVAGGTILFLTLIFLLFSFGAIGVFSHEHIQRYTWPVLSFVRVIDFPYFLFDQAGLLLLIDWVALIFITTGFLQYAIALGCTGVLGVLDYKTFVWLLLPATFVLVMLPEDVTRTKMLFDVLRKIGFLFYYVYPIALWLAAVISRRRRKTVET